MEKAKLQAVAAELNDLLGLDPVINVDAAEAEIEGKIKEAVLLIEKGDKVSSDSVTALVELGFTEHLTACGLIKAKKEKKAKAKAEKGESKPGVIATIVAQITAGPKTKDQVLAALVKAFPERTSEAMKSTLTIQLGGRLKKDKGLNIVKDAEGRYSLA